MQTLLCLHFTKAMASSEPGLPCPEDLLGTPSLCAPSQVTSKAGCAQAWPALPPLPPPVNALPHFSLTSLS